MNGPGNHAEHIWPGLGSCGERKCVSSEPGVPRQDAWGRGAPATPPPAHDPKEAEARPAPGVLKQLGSGNRNFSDGG